MTDVERYYTDELGFYRHLDLNQMQYVCSNISATTLHQNQIDCQQLFQDNFNRERRIKVTRKRLRISHFDRTYGYEEWKRDWDEYIQLKLSQGRPVTLNRELKLRIRTGIPHDYRCKVWAALIRMRTRHIQKQFEGSVSVYAKLTLYKANKLNQEHEASLKKFFRQIELDLLRTLPNNRHFEDPHALGTERVRRVLRAYARFNPTVGYCQGMNRLAAMALLILPEEEAFWCLVDIIHCIMPKDYYLKPWLAQVDCCVLSDLLEKKLPRLHKHLVRNDIQLTVFTWFFTIFVDGFKPELTLRIWDCFLLEGDKVLFRFAIAILYMSQDNLLKMQDFTSMNFYLSQLVSTESLDIQHLFESKYIFLKTFSSSDRSSYQVDLTTN